MTVGQTGVWATLLHQLQVSHMVKTILAVGVKRTGFSLVSSAHLNLSHLSCPVILNSFQ